LFFEIGAKSDTVVKTVNSEKTESQLSKDAAGEAVWPGKEAWKNEPGNRYTPEDLREMSRNWNVKIARPRIVQVRRAD
jgi:hypothetical protein